MQFRRNVYEYSTKTLPEREQTFVTFFPVTCFHTFFADPLPSFNWWAVMVGGEELKWRQLARHHLISQQGPHCSPQSTAKTKDKNTNLRKMICNGMYKRCSVRFSILGENPSEEVVVYDNYYYEFIDGFWRELDFDFSYETEARKVMVDFKIDALYR